MRETLGSPAFSTQTAPRVTAIPSGCGPTLIVAVTAFVRGSIRMTASSACAETQTAPLPAAASPQARGNGGHGLLRSSWIRATTVFARGSMRVSFETFSLPAQTAPSRPRTHPAPPGWRCSRRPCRPSAGLGARGRVGSELSHAVTKAASAHARRADAARTDWLEVVMRRSKHRPPPHIGDRPEPSADFRENPEALGASGLMRSTRPVSSRSQTEPKPTPAGPGSRRWAACRRPAGAGIDAIDGLQVEDGDPERAKPEARRRRVRLAPRRGGQPVVRASILPTTSPQLAAAPRRRPCLPRGTRRAKTGAWFCR